MNDELNLSNFTQEIVRFKMMCIHIYRENL